MAFSIKHQFVSLKGDGTDATQVQPSSWNAAHAATMSSGKFLGRLSAGDGAVEEITISSYMAGLLAANDANALSALIGLFDTGDVKYTFKTAAPAGWLLVNGNSPNIGNAASGANLRANADTYNLFALIYAACGDTIAPVSGGRSGNALTDFNANKTLTIPQLSCKSPMGAGSVSGLTARTLGAGYGEETHTLTIAEMPRHYHVCGIFDPSHTHGHNITAVNSSTTGGGGFTIPGYGTPTISANSTGVRLNSDNGLDTTYSAGSSAAHNVIHPVVALNAMVKL